MDNNNLISKNNYLTRQRNAFAILTAVLILANLLLVLILANIARVTVLVPSRISGEYIIEDDQVNDVYLKDRADELIRVILNVTPNNLDQMYDNVLKAVRPENHFELKAALKKFGKEVTTRNITTAFYPKSVTVDTKNFTADISGEFYTILGNSFISKNRSYRLAFVYNGYDLSLLNFTEITEEKND